MAGVKHQHRPPAPVLRDGDLRVRDIGDPDMDAIIALYAGAFIDETISAYRFPLRHQYPEDYKARARGMLAKDLEKMKAGLSVGHIVEARPEAEHQPWPVAAFAVWRLAGGGTAPVAPGDPAEESGRRDAHLERNRVARENIKTATRKYFDEVYGDRQVYLVTLVVGPGYQRRGIGAALVRWGVEEGRRERVPVTLFASTSGERLYRRLGFREVGVHSACVPGESEGTSIKGMVFDQVE